MLERAGAAGILSNSWSRGWGVDKIQSARVNGDSVVRRVVRGLQPARAARDEQPAPARARDRRTRRSRPNESPVFNTIATIRGSEKPNEYVMLSAHLDSWDAGSGATDNGTGTITMLEAMRILQAGVSASEADDSRRPLERRRGGRHRLVGVRGRSPRDPERDCRRCSTRTTAPARSTRVQTNGFIDAAPALARWMSRMPADITKNIALMLPGVAHDESTDSDAFDCRDAPGFFLDVVGLVVRRLHVAHQPRHVRQDQLRRREAERDARRDVRLPGVRGSDLRLARAARAADRSAHRSAGARAGVLQRPAQLGGNPAAVAGGVACTSEASHIGEFMAPPFGASHLRSEC